MSAANAFLLRLVLILGCAVVLAFIAVGYQLERMVDKPSEFCSEAKLSVNSQLINQEMKDRELGQSSGTTADLLESAELSRRAMERVKALHPDLAGSAVTIRTVQTRSSAISIFATGSEPKYTRIFLDALLDEFIAFRHDTREKAEDPELQKTLTETAALEKELQETAAALDKAKAAAGSTSLTSDHPRLLTRLTTQRNLRDDLRLKIKDVAETDASRSPLQARLSAIEQEVRDIEAKLKHHEAATSEVQELTEKLDAVKQAYAKKVEHSDKLQTAIDTDPDFAVMERATPSFEIVDDWKKIAAKTAGGAGLLGAIFGLVISQVIISPPKSKKLPTGF